MENIINIQVIDSEFTGVPIFVQVQEDYAPVQSVNGKIGWVTIDKSDVGISNVENVSIVNTSGYLQNNINSLSNDVVYLTGYQEISGYKYFLEGLDSNYIAIYPAEGTEASVISFYNKSGSYVDLYIDNAPNFEYEVKLPTNNGTLLTDQSANVLFTSGVQIISGLKIISGRYPPSEQYSIDDIRESGAYFFIDDAERFQYHIIAPASQNNYVKFGPYSLGKLHKDTADLFFTTNGLVNTTNSLSNEISGVSGELQNQINSISGEAYSNSNPSGFITGIDLSAYVTKFSGTFTNRPTVNGTGVLLSGEAASLPATIVYTTGNQTISGVKNFATRPQVNNIGVVISGEAYPSNNPSGFITGVNLSSYVQIQQLNDLQPDEGGIIVSYAGGLWDSVSNNIGFNAQDGDLIILRNGSPIAGITPQALTSFRAYTLPNSNGTIALLINANPIFAPNLVYNTGQQSISGTKNFTTRPQVNNINVVISGEAYPSNNPSGYITGVNLSSYATIANLASTGNNLQNQINSLSGSAVLLYGNQTIDGTKTFRNSVYIHDLYVTGTEFIANVENNFIESPYILLNLTGGAVDGGIFFVTGAGLTGVNDYGPIIGFDHSNKFKFGFARRSDDLSVLNDIAAVQDLTNYSGFVNNNYYGINNPSGFITGVNLSNYITKTSGEFFDRPTVNGTGILLSGDPVVSTSNLQKLIINLSTGIETYIGAFDQTFSSVPSIVGTMQTTGDYMYMVGFNSVTASGFVADFSDFILESGVKLNIIAYDQQLV